MVGNFNRKRQNLFMETQAKRTNYAKGEVDYNIGGSGKAIVLIHGAGASALSNWYDTIPILIQDRLVISINLVGAGNTTYEGQTLQMSELIDLVLSVVDKEKIETFDLIGYSTGAVVASAIAGKYDYRVSSVILMAPWARSDARMSSFYELWRHVLISDKNLFAHFNTHLALSQKSQSNMDEIAFNTTIDNFTQTGFNEDLEKTIQFLRQVELSELLPKITARTLVIGFADDRIVPLTYTKEVCRLIPNADYQEIESGHGGPWEATESMNELILKFLNK